MPTPSSRRSLGVAARSWRALTSLAAVSLVAGLPLIWLRAAEPPWLDVSANGAHVGVLYEGVGELSFLRFPVAIFEPATAR